MKLGLRVDVDTLRGHLQGVPTLYKILAQRQIQASFFFTVGPDNMGRHIWRLLKPQFLRKMLRSKAPNLYGWDIVLRGTLWPGPRIAERDKILGKDILKNCVPEGHELGLHAWDHHQWQTLIQYADRQTIGSWLDDAYQAIEETAGVAPTCSASPAWRCTDNVLLEKERFKFYYNSDCRGQGIFYPNVNGQILKTPQVATSLPTYDELIGEKGMSDEIYNAHLINLIQKQTLPVLTIHAEAEGGSKSKMFEEFLDSIIALGIEPVALGELVSETGLTAEPKNLFQRELPGREGWLSAVN